MKERDLMKTFLNPEWHSPAQWIIAGVIVATVAHAVKLPHYQFMDHPSASDAHIEMSSTYAGGISIAGWGR